jgi:hypothetical protein
MFILHKTLGVKTARLQSHTLFAVASIFAGLFVLLETHGQAEEIIEYLANDPKTSVSDLVSERVKHSGGNNVRQQCITIEIS